MRCTNRNEPEATEQERRRHLSSTRRVRDLRPSSVPDPAIGDPDSASVIRMDVLEADLVDVGVRVVLVIVAVLMGVFDVIMVMRGVGVGVCAVPMVVLV